MTTFDGSFSRASHSLRSAILKIINQNRHSMSADLDLHGTVAVLWNALVENPQIAHDVFSTLEENVRPNFEEKQRLYRIALLLLVLFKEEEHDADIQRLRAYAESQLYALNRYRYEDVKAAMSDLGKLLAPVGNPRELTWAKAWLNGVGVEIWNPATLALFAMEWMDFYTLVVDTVRQKPFVRG